MAHALPAERIRLRGFALTGLHAMEAVSARSFARDPHAALVAVLALGERPGRLLRGGLALASGGALA